MHKLKNFNEYIVDHLIHDILKQYTDICKCDKCILDIKAITLNHMDPKYVVSEKGELFSKMNYQFKQQEIINATKFIVQAIELVSKNPHH